MIYFRYRQIPLLECSIPNTTSKKSADSGSSGTGMLLDTALLHEYRSKGEILRFESPQLLELDISDLSPEESAARIVEHIAALDKPS
jgi:hypothetical protein